MGRWGSGRGDVLGSQALEEVRRIATAEGDQTAGRDVGVALRWWC